MDFNLETLNGVTQGANGITGAIRGAAELVGVLKGLVKSPESRSGPEVEAAIEKLALTIQNAQLQNSLLEVQLRALKNEISAAEAAKAQLDRYKLYRTPAGSLVYRLREGDDAGEPEHFICPKCYQKGLRSILQGKNYTLHCLECGKAFSLNPNPNAGRLTGMF